MLLATSFLATNWLSRILQKRKMEGLNTTRPWMIINLTEDGNKIVMSDHIFTEDLYLEININDLPSLSNNVNDDTLKEIYGFIKKAYVAPVPYWAIISCNSGNNKSAAVSKWISDSFLIPIEALYSGHNINTLNLSRKIYNALESFNV